MQNGAQDKPDLSGKLLGFVRVVVGGHVFDLAVQSMSLEKDGEKSAGGFFSDNGQLGIVVDDTVTPPEMKEQLEKATAQAVRHLSQKVLN